MTGAETLEEPEKSEQEIINGLLLSADQKFSELLELSLPEEKRTSPSRKAAYYHDGRLIKTVIELENQHIPLAQHSQATDVRICTIRRYRTDKDGIFKPSQPQKGSPYAFGWYKQEETEELYGFWETRFQAGARNMSRAAVALNKILQKKFEPIEYSDLYKNNG
jgi:hypothetical protein